MAFKKDTHTITLKKSGKVALVDWALETGEGTKINNVWEKVPRIYDSFTKKFARVREHGASWIIYT